MPAGSLGASSSPSISHTRLLLVSAFAASLKCAMVDSPAPARALAYGKSFPMVVSASGQKGTCHARQRLTHDAPVSHGSKLCNLKPSPGPPSKLRQLTAKSIRLPGSQEREPNTVHEKTGGYLVQCLLKVG